MTVASAVASAASSTSEVAAAPSDPPVLHVPRAAHAIVPTGHFNVDAWTGAVSTHTLLDASGRGAVPVSEARFLWGSGQLYVFFYAGDLDLQAHVKHADGPVWNDDSVALTFSQSDGTQRIIQISVTGVVADGKCPADARDLADARCDLAWQSGARVGTDSDGTLNQIGDRDEEWAVEVAIPLTAIGGPAGGRVPFAIRRQEIAHDGPRQRGSWGGALVLEDTPAHASPPALAHTP
jgi:hypothetical protein